MKRACGKVLRIVTWQRGEFGRVIRCRNPRPWWRVLLGMTCAPCEARR